MSDRGWADASTRGAPEAGGSGQNVKLFLGGLSWESTEDHVRDYFSKYGEIVEVVVMRDRNTGKPRGFGFITFKDAAVAEQVCSVKHDLDGRQIDAKRSVPQNEKPKSRKIFVGGLAPDTTADEFRDYFSRFGTVTDAQIMQDHDSHRSRGFGFVTFQEDESVEKVFAAGPMHMLAGKRAEVKAATPRGSGRGRGAPPFYGGAGAEAGFAPGMPYMDRTQYPQEPFGGPMLHPSYPAYPMAGYPYGLGFGLGQTPYGPYRGMMMGGTFGPYGAFGPYPAAGYPAGVGLPPSQGGASSSGAYGGGQSGRGAGFDPDPGHTSRGS